MTVASLLIFLINPANVFPGPISIKRSTPSASIVSTLCCHLTEEEIRHNLKVAVEQGAGLAIGTRGPLSVFAYDGKRYYEQEACKVEEVKDALGAGDSFIGAFLVNYLQYDEWTEEERISYALKQAVEHAASVIQVEGSIGVGYDVEADQVKEMVGIQNE